MIKRLFWDIETSPNIGFFWRPGYKLNIPHENIVHEAAIICICWKWENGKKIHSLQWDKGNDKEMIEQFLEIAKAADELVAHNGDKFDLKWFNARCIKHGLTVPELKTVDTLVIARRRFYFASNRLDYLAKFLFNEGKIKTDFGLWRDIVLDNSPKAMADMVRYCKKDVVLLQRVWEKLQPFHKNKTHVGVLMGRDRWTCPHCGSMKVYKSKNMVTTAGIRQHQMKCKDCFKYYTIPQHVYNRYQELKHSIEEKK